MGRAAAAARVACGVLLLLACVQLALAVGPFVVGRLRMPGQYLTIPGKTIMRSGTVENSDYIAARRIAGLRYKYDVGRPEPVAARRWYHGITTVKGPGVDHEVYALYPEGITDPREIQSAARKGIEELARIARPLSPEDREFVAKNRIELHWQILNRWIVHHHNHVLGPVNEVALGKDIDETYSQYGWVNTLLLARLLALAGGVSWHAYFKVFYSFYFFYYALFVVAAFLLLRRVELVLAAALLAFGAIDWIGYNFLFLGPGINPLRHFLDMPLLVAFILYLRRETPLRLAVTLLTGLACVLHGGLMGLFAHGALVAAMAVRVAHERPARPAARLALLAAALAAGLALFLGVKVGQDYMFGYFVNGYLGFLGERRTLLLLAVAIVGGGILLTRLLAVRRGDVYATIFLFCYSVGLLFYYVWGSDRNHFLVLAPVFGLTLVAIARLALERWAPARGRAVGVAGAAALLLLVACYYLPAVRSFLSTKKEIDAVFRDHVTYRWDFPAARFESTMDPRPFAEAARLIRSRTPDEEKGIYIISKYDNLLPLLAGKHSRMPFFEVGAYLLTPKETGMCLDAVRRGRPRYLFVDTDIDRDLAQDVVGIFPVEFVEEPDKPWYLHAESSWRVLQHELLAKLFDALRADYAPVEKGTLLTAWERLPGR